MPSKIAIGSRVRIIEEMVWRGPCACGLNSKLGIVLYRAGTLANAVQHFVLGPDRDPGKEKRRLQVRGAPVCGGLRSGTDYLLGVLMKCCRKIKFPPVRI